MNITLNRTVDLSSPILPEVLSAPLYEGEKNAHTFVIAAAKNKLPYPLSGSVVAYFERADGNTVRVEGETKDGAAYVTLPPECYQTGVFYLAVMLISDGAQTVIYAASGRVKNTQEGEIINGGDAIPTYDEIMAHLNKYLNANISAKVEQKEDGALITLTDADGTTQAFVRNGKDGSGAGGGSSESGKDGEDGATFTPNVDEEGNLTWTNDKGLPNPDTVNIKGPQGNEGEPGEPGKSAYEIAIDNGLSPDIPEKDWLASLQGADGKSAYEIALENGFEGTEEEWLYSTDNDPYYITIQKVPDANGYKTSDDFDYAQMVNAYKQGRPIYITSTPFDTQAEMYSELVKLYDNRAIFSAVDPNGLNIVTVYSDTSALINGGNVTMKGQKIVGAVNNIQPTSTSFVGNIFLHAADIPDSVLTVNEVAPDDNGNVALKSKDIPDLDEYIAQNAPTASGEDGATFTPSVDPEGNLSWTNDKGLPNPPTANIKGPQGPKGEPGEKGDKGDKGDPAELPFEEIGEGLEVVGNALRVKPESEYELIDIIALGYDRLTEKPEDWETNWGNYYEATAGLLNVVASYRAWEPWKYFKSAEYVPVSKIEIDEEPDGTPFNFRKMYIDITTPQNDSKKVGVVNVNGRSIVYNAGMLDAAGAEKGAGTRVFCEIDGGIFTNRAIAGGFNGGLGWSNANQYVSGFAILNQSDINYMNVALLNGVTFPEGTVLKIYGVRNNA